MGHMRITYKGVTMTMEQMLAVVRLGESLGEFEWHANACGCCITVHPKGKHDRGYVVGEDGEADWLDLSQK